MKVKMQIFNIPYSARHFGAELWCLFCRLVNFVMLRKKNVIANRRLLWCNWNSKWQIDLQNTNWFVQTGAIYNAAV